MSYFLGRRKKNFNSTHHQFSFISTKFTTPFERLASYCDALQAPKKKFKVLRTPTLPKEDVRVEGLGKLTTMTSTTKTTTEAITTHKTKRVCNGVLAFVKGKGILFPCLERPFFCCCPGVTVDQSIHQRKFKWRKRCFPLRVFGTHCCRVINRK